jgi:hypothetical protein
VGEGKRGREAERARVHARSKARTCTLTERANANTIAHCGHDLDIFSLKNIRETLPSMCSPPYQAP